jgi:hypothetical protein
MRVHLYYRLPKLLELLPKAPAQLSHACLPHTMQLLHTISRLNAATSFLNASKAI